jgi:hypothetical protein
MVPSESGHAAGQGPVLIAVFARAATHTLTLTPPVGQEPSPLRQTHPPNALQAVARRETPGARSPPASGSPLRACVGSAGGRHARYRHGTRVEAAAFRRAAEGRTSDWSRNSTKWLRGSLGMVWVGRRMGERGPSTARVPDSQDNGSLTCAMASSTDKGICSGVDSYRLQVLWIVHIDSKKDNSYNSRSNKLSKYYLIHLRSLFLLLIKHTMNVVIVS